MAKNESKKKESASIAAKAAAKIGKEVLAANKSLSEVYVTADGTAFYNRNDAQNHARALENREVWRQSREPEVQPEEATTAEAEAKEEKNEPETKE